MGLADGKGAPGTADPIGKTVSSDPFLVSATTSNPFEGAHVLAGRYEILGMLGAGAMGTVYRARDRELDEIVALKVLRREIASAEMLERFRREVKLARRVTHKNVARTYDIGEHEGDRFLTMEFIEGEMLASVLERRGKLPLSEVRDIALSVLAGLEAAHAADVLHRDLKPENVILASDPQRGAVITDFGIARVTSRGDLSRTVGGIVGTPAYMAPEQVEGASDLDVRADLYALGAMLYELLSGALAWAGDSAVTVAAGRLLRPPPDIRDIAPTTPPEVADLILKLMARRREDRFASAAEAADALSSLSISSHRQPSPVTTRSSVTAAIGEASRGATMPLSPPMLRLEPLVRLDTPRGARVVTVLPILSTNTAEDGYLIDCVHEDIIDALSVVPSLLVRPRGATANQTDPSRDAREIGRSLGADVVVDGSLRRMGDAVRASFRLIAVEDGFQLWAKRFERPSSEVLAIADDAAQAIAKALTAEAPRERARTADPEAEDLYLRGRYLMRRGWQSAPREALDMLARAHERAGDDARIVGTYALCLARVYGLDHFGQGVAEHVREIAAKAVSLDPNQPEAHVAIATVHLQNAEPEIAVKHFQAALDVAPNSLDALDWLGRITAEAGYVDEGISLLERAITHDPEYVAARQQIGRLRGLVGDRAGLLRDLGDIPKHPGDVAAWFLIQCRDLLWYRDEAAARALLRRLESTELPPTARLPISSMLKIALGERGDLEPSLFDRLLPVDSSRTPRRAAFNAQVRVELLLSFDDQHEAALSALGDADRNGYFDIVWLDRCPTVAPLRAMPGFAEIYGRIKERANRVARALFARHSMPARPR